MASSIPFSEILICEDHYVSACGLELALRKHLPQTLHVRTAFTGKDALELIRQEPPHLAVIDLLLPDISGIEVIKALRAHSPSTRILVITAHDDPHLIQQACRLRVDAVLLKTNSDENIQGALKSLHSRKRGTFLDPSVQAIFEDKQSKTLTLREYEVLEFMATGLTSAEIATRMDCLVSTVKTYRNRIMKKSGCRNSAEIIAWYLKGNRKQNLGSTT